MASNGIKTIIINWYYDLVWSIICIAQRDNCITSKGREPWAWPELLGDAVDVAIPLVGGLGEAVRVLKVLYAIDETVDAVQIANNTIHNLFRWVEQKVSLLRIISISLP